MISEQKIIQELIELKTTQDIIGKKITLEIDGTITVIVTHGIRNGYTIE